MTKGAFVLGMILLSVMFVSCDETVSQRAAFVEKPVLFAILVGRAQNPNRSHDVILTKLFNDEILAPNGNTTDRSSAVMPFRFELGPNTRATDPGLQGALVILQSRDAMDTLREQPKRKPTIYSGNSFSLHQNDSVTVTAHLPNGGTLRAATLVPLYRAIEIFPPYSGGVTTFVNRFTNGNAWILDWSGNLTDEHLFAPRLTLSYSKSVNDAEVLRSVLVPLTYVQAPQGITPVFSGVTYETSMSVDFDALDSTMAQISAGDPDKQSYKVLSFVLSLIEYDVHASHYYSSINGSLDEFSIRLDETTYSNVSGGIGVFGSCAMNDHYYEINSRYARSFGYRSAQ